MNTKELEKIVESYGYDVLATMTKRVGDEEQQGFLCVKHTDSGAAISAQFREDGTFFLQYNLNDSVDYLRTPDCGSLQNSEHFKRIEHKFIQHAEILHNAVKLRSEM